MPREAARALVRALRPVIEQQMARRGPQAVRATIFTLGGVPGDRTFQAQMHGADIILTERLVTLGSTVATYDLNYGLVVGDTLDCVEMKHGDFVAFEVESDTDVV